MSTADIEKHLTDYHASNLGLYCERKSKTPVAETSHETRETHTQILFIEQNKSIKVVAYKNESTEQLSTPDHLPPRTQQLEEPAPVEVDENSNSSVVEFFDTTDQMMDEQEATT